MPQPERTAEEVSRCPRFLWEIRPAFAMPHDPIIVSDNDADLGAAIRRAIDMSATAEVSVRQLPPGAKPQPPGPTDALRWACEAGALLDGGHGKGEAASDSGGLTRGSLTTVSPDDAGPDFVGSLV